MIYSNMLIDSCQVGLPQVTFRGKNIPMCIYVYIYMYMIIHKHITILRQSVLTCNVIIGLQLSNVVSPNKPNLTLGALYYTCCYGPWKEMIHVMVYLWNMLVFQFATWKKSKKYYYPNVYPHLQMVIPLISHYISIKFIYIYISLSLLIYRVL